MFKVNRNNVTHSNLESCHLHGYADADMGWPRQAPLGWNQAERIAWFNGYDSYGEQEVRNAA